MADTGIRDEQPLLWVSNLTTGYGQTTVLETVSLKVSEGETVGLLGPNGHGKTTLLRTISGLHSPWSGEIAFSGQIINRVPPHALVGRGLVHVPQGDLLFGDLTVEENLFVGAYVREAWRRRHEALKIVWATFPSLEPRRRTLAKNLSGGERRMTAIGRALMSSARMVMLDEPLLGLAPIAIDGLYAALVKLREMGLTILIVDETADRISTIVDRLYVLDTGQIVAEGTTAEVMGNRAVIEAYLG